MTWKLFAMACAGAMIGTALYRWYQNQPHGSDMSFAWLNEQERRALKQSAQIDGVSWKWPVNKIKNEHPAFNRERLRKRA